MTNLIQICLTYPLVPIHHTKHIHDNVDFTQTKQYLLVLIPTN